MNKIDLHLHTQQCKSGDGNGRAISVDSFINNMTENKVVICAITNHNKFDIGEFIEIARKAPGLVIFPGIELDIEYENDKVKHIVVICNPKVAAEFNECFSNDPARNFDGYKLAYDTFIEKIKEFKNNEIIVIPHFLDKDKKRALTISEKDKLKSDLSDYVVLLETGKLKSMGIINAHNEISLFGSDVKDWDDYSNNANLLPRLKFPIDSFGKFYQLASNNKTFIKTALNEMDKIEIAIKDSTVTIYDDINVIFGEKGSGKTWLINNYILPQLKEKGKDVIFHEGKDYQKSYEGLIERLVSQVEVDKELQEKSIVSLTYILNYKENQPSNFIEAYMNYHIDEKISNNAKIIQKTETSYSKVTLESEEEIFRKIKENHSDISKVEQINQEIREKENPKYILLSNELTILKDEITVNAVNRLRENFSINQTDQLIEHIKSVLDKKTGKKSKPNAIGFSSFVAKRLAFLNKRFELLESFENQKCTKRFILGKLPNKGDIFIRVSIKIMKSNETWYSGSPFDRGKITANREVIKKILTFSSENFRDINSLFSVEEMGKDSKDYIQEFIKKDVQIVNRNDELYIPSEGEKSILSITGILENTSYDCYIFDEIERGLGNKYISDHLISKLIYLRDVGKMIILSTHNANIAISTLPSQTIYCDFVNDTSSNIYFEGNMYSNELISINSGTQSHIWEEQALKHLEGSEEMFGIRRNIWKLKK